jgi:hypothetical protein
MKQQIGATIAELQVNFERYHMASCVNRWRFRDIEDRDQIGSTALPRTLRLCDVEVLTMGLGDSYQCLFCEEISANKSGGKRQRRSVPDRIVERTGVTGVRHSPSS